MKQTFIFILFNLFCAIGTFLQAQNCGSNLFFSEYSEGNYNNKSLELYNPTPDSIDLFSYRICNWVNGNDTLQAQSCTVLTDTVGTHYYIKAFSTFVITLDKQDCTANGVLDTCVFPALQAKTQLFLNPFSGAKYTMYFNGNDALSLEQNDGSGNYLIQDIFGRIGENPGVAWTDTYPFNVDTIGTKWTKDHTLIRKPNVKNGVKTNPEFFDPTAEWVKYPKNMWDSLGTHHINCFTTLCPNIATLNITGTSTLNSITFNWAPVEHSINYEISYAINGGVLQNTSTNNTSYTVGSLLPQSQVCIFITPVGEQGCGLESKSLCLTSQDCPNLEVSILNLPATMCQGEVYTLTANPLGGTFLVDGIAAAIFNGSVPGPHTVCYNFTNTNTCLYNTCQQVTVFPKPVSPTINLINNNTLTIENIYGANATANWFLNNILQATGFEFMPNQSANYCALITDVNGCLSNPVCYDFEFECPTHVLDILGVLPYYCANEPIVVNLSGTVDGNPETSLTFSIDGGANISSFTPAELALGSHTITQTYIDDAQPMCPQYFYYDFIINSPPTSDFTVQSPICQTNSTTVTYTGTANQNNPAVAFNWNFNGGVVTQIGALQSYAVIWTNTGTKTITLNIIDQNGCSSTTSHNVSIDEPLAIPIITCSSTTNSVTFAWNNYNLDTTYLISYSVNGNLMPKTTTIDPTFTVNNLLPNTDVQISLTVLSNNSCSDVSQTATCTTTSCPPQEIVFNIPTTYCEGGQTVELLASPPGGTFTINGQAATELNPSETGAGTHTINYQYTDNGNCTYTEQQIITIQEVPAAPIVTQNGNTLTSNYATGNTWYFDGNAIPNATEQSYTITQSGIYNVFYTDGVCLVGSIPNSYTFVGINQINTSNITLYPNPCANQLNVQTSKIGKTAKLSITNMLGEVIINTTLFEKSNYGTISTQLLNNGVYIASITFDNEAVINKKIVISK